jgi:hypothetical protein
MAHSITPTSLAKPVPDGDFLHGPSQTRFVIRSTPGSMTHTMIRGAEHFEVAPAFVVGSGNHAFGYLFERDHHLFQSPLSFYARRNLWDMAPGYEADPNPGFTRPVTPACLFCHSGKSLPVVDTLNSYQPGVLGAYGITCDRCHGTPVAHLKSPVPGSILNPSKLSGALRASVCEQCHLTGEIRIPNPDRSITDFRPGQTLEDFYTTYVVQQQPGNGLKVVSHVEQLAQSTCARRSGDRLWCGTCHNPHDKPTAPALYYRAKCLGCHAATLERSHAKEGQDCVGCHMPKLPAKDGGHTAFTDHRIRRRTAIDVAASVQDLSPWREPDSKFRDRNLAIALVTIGLQNGSSNEVIRGYRLLNRSIKDFPNDPLMLTTLGTVLMKGKQPAEALKQFERVVQFKPRYAPYYVNTATALLELNKAPEAIQNLRMALELDPLLEAAVALLCKTYTDQGRLEAARQTRAAYEREMRISH